MEDALRRGDLRPVAAFPAAVSDPNEVTALDRLMASVDAVTAAVEITIPANDLAGARASYDQLAAEAADAGMDRFVLGAVTVAYLITIHKFEPAMAVGMARLWAT